MDEYKITKHVTPKMKNPFKGLINVFIIILAVPVIILSIVSLSIYFLVMQIIFLFYRRKPSGVTAEYYHHEFELVHNQHLKITLVEDELDTELSSLNERWMENVYERETCLYRAKTTPVIEELEGEIICFFIKELPEGVVLQVLQGLDHTRLLTTQLLFLRYHNLKVTVIDEAGPFYLYNDDKNTNLIRGFNKMENIKMVLSMPALP
ncbi:MAG: hypothetical protein WKF89_06060 [Chitinophagaceae bacterium]